MTKAEANAAEIASILRGEPIKHEWIATAPDASMFDYSGKPWRWQSRCGRIFSNIDPIHKRELRREHAHATEIHINCADCLYDDLANS